MRFKNELNGPGRDIYTLHSGTSFDWPIFKVPRLSLESDLVKITNFVALKFRTNDLRTIRNYFSRASIKTEGAPHEVTQYYEIMFFENIINGLFNDFRNRPGSETINAKIEENTDHGYSHQRRLEKMLKEFLKNDRHSRSNPNLLFNSLSQLLTIRFHDVLELLPTGKNHHTEGGALLVLGFLLDNKPLFDSLAIKNGSTPPNNNVYKKIIMSTFLNCLYHTNPKELEIVNANISNADRASLNDLLLPKSKEKLKKAHEFFIEKLGDNHELVALIKKGQEYIKSQGGNRETDRIEAVDMITSAKVFSALDKLDSVLPSELSTAKTIVTMAKIKRPFFAPIDIIVYDDFEIIKTDLTSNPDFKDIVEKIKQKQKLDITEEYKIRLLLANSTASPDDFSRFIFEISRLDWIGLPEWIMAGFKQAFEKKADFLIEVIPKLFQSEDPFSLFSNIYLQAETDLVTELLMKYQINQKQIEEIQKAFSQIDNDEERIDFVNQEIGVIPEINLSGLNKGILLLRNERNKLGEILTKKIAQLREANDLNPDNVETILELLKMANNNRPKIETELPFESGYVGYYAIT